MKKYILIIFVVGLILGCKNEKPQDAVKITEPQKVEKTEEIEETGVKIIVNTIVPLDDIITLRYTENEDLKFKPKEFIRVKVNGNNAPQDIEFSLPEGLAPTRMALFYGPNNKSGMVLNSVKFSLADWNFNVEGTRIWNFFNPNKYISFNKENNSFEGNDIDGKYAPGFNFRNVLIKKLEASVL